MNTLFLGIITLCILTLTIFSFSNIVANGLQKLGLKRNQFSKEMDRLHNLTVQKNKSILTDIKADILKDIYDSMVAENYNYAQVVRHDTQDYEAMCQVADELNSYGMFSAEVETKQTEDCERYELNVKRNQKYIYSSLK